MLEGFKFEVNRLARSKLIPAIFVLFFAAALYTTFTGTSDYLDFVKEKEQFKQYESDIFKRWVNYSQYGDSGFRVLYQPDSLSIFFNRSAAFDYLFSNIDMSEIIDANRSSKGKRVFTKKSLIGDLSGLFLIFGTLLMMYMGMGSFKHEKYFFRFSNIIARLIILVVFVFLLGLVLINVPKFFGIQLANAKILVFYLIYALMTNPAE